jgi:geranylgeranyl transferase type-1 subunit beta
MALDLPSHVRYFFHCLHQLPQPYTSLDTNRLTVAYFCVSALDLLGALDRIADERSALIRWVYSQQLRRPEAEQSSECWVGGFRGAHIFGMPFDAAGVTTSSPFDTGHIAMTYTALAVLLILGDDLSGVDRAATLRHVRSLQQSDGSFRAFAGGESDMRFVYCAAAICAMLRDGGGVNEELGEEGVAHEWEGMDKALATKYVLASQAFDGALGLGPGAEAHGGST